MSRLDKKDPYHMMFIEETNEQIARMEQELLVLETGRVDDEAINTIFRMAHSLKGASATLDIHEMSELSHHLESLLMKVRSQELNLEGDVMDIVLSAIDHLREIHSGLMAVEGEAVDIQEITNRISDLLELRSGKHVSKVVDPTAAQWASPDVDFRTGLAPGIKVIDILFEENIELKCVKAFMVVNNLSAVGTVVKVYPEDYEDLSDEEFGELLVVALDSTESSESIEKSLEPITDLKKITIEAVSVEALSNPNVPASMPMPVRTPRKTSENKLSAGGEEKTSVRVNIQKINQLINLVGELIIDKEALNKLSGDLKRKYRKDPAVNRLLDVYQHIDYLGSELQEIILSTRMLPLETIFNKFPRMIRDLALKCNKNVNFVIEGKETGIDRGIIEELVDPLTHLLRNAVDHGIGSPEVRIAKGKPEIGTVTLSANQGENHVIITVADDGNGIDTNRIRQKVVENGLLSAEQADEMQTEELIQWVFEPGFSTAKEVSDISGRGVGLDVVKSNISRLHGIIEITTNLNVGTKFIIKLPLTLAIIKAMLIREGCCTFAIPVASIVEVIRLKGNECRECIHSTAKNEVFSWRDQVLPLIWLGNYFEMPSIRPTEKLYVVIVGLGEKKTAIVVERILGEQEVVIKSMGDFVGPGKLFGDLKGISGVSILGDGSFAQIIDVAAMMKKKVVAESE